MISFDMSLFNSLKNNWKKSLFFSVGISYGICSLKSHYEIQKHMRNVINEASSYSGTTHKTLPRNILVVINPKANNSKAAGYFQKFCEPILHSAGFTVECIKTSYVGHAKAYLESADKMPDAVIVAGGDGTASEVITGLMRNSKSSCPVAILPMGSKNKMPSIFGRVEYLKCLTRSVLCILNGTVQPENLVKYELISSSDEDLNNSKPIYGINSFTWGVLRDLESIQDKYWYFGYFKSQAAVLFNAFSDKLSWKCTANLIYTPPCSGCSNCTQKINMPASKFKWLNVMHNNTKNNLLNLSNVQNDECNKLNCCTVETSQLSIESHYNSENVAELITKTWTSLSPGFNFVQKSFVNMYSIEKEPSLKINSRTIQIIPSNSCKSKYFSIDGEDYEVRPIKITVMPKAIQVFK